MHDVSTVTPCRHTLTIYEAITYEFKYGYRVLKIVNS